MKNPIESHSEKKKRAYAPPAFKRVRLEIKTSVLGTCSLSFPTSISGDPATCVIPFNCVT